jgi:hypothetical protein
MNPMTIVAAMIATVIRAWGLTQGMAATMAAALKYDTFLAFTSCKTLLLASCNFLVKIEQRSG